MILSVLAAKEFWREFSTNVVNAINTTVTCARQRTRKVSFVMTASPKNLQNLPLQPMAKLQMHQFKSVCHTMELGRSAGVLITA